MAGSLEEVAGWLKLAVRAEEVARRLLEEGYLRESMSRSYYAMFYAAKAILVSEGVPGSKHSSVISSFGRLFAKTGRVPSHLHSYLVDSLDDRRLADYAPDWEPSTEETELRLANASEFVAAVGSLVSRARFSS